MKLKLLALLCLCSTLNYANGHLESDTTIIAHGYKIEMKGIDSERWSYKSDHRTIQKERQTIISMDSIKALLPEGVEVEGFYSKEGWKALLSVVSANGLKTVFSPSNWYEAYYPKEKCIDIQSCPPHFLENSSINLMTGEAFPSGRFIQYSESEQYISAHNPSGRDRMLLLMYYDSSIGSYRELLDIGAMNDYDPAHTEEVFWLGENLFFYIYSKGVWELTISKLD